MSTLTEMVVHIRILFIGEIKLFTDLVSIIISSHLKRYISVHIIHITSEYLRNT